MTFYDIALARTKQDTLELVAVEYETIGRITMPTKQADKFLERFKSWRNLSEALRFNPVVQAELENTFGKYIE
jgi:hypothetical protein